MTNPFETINERLTHIEGLLTTLTETQGQAAAPAPDELLTVQQAAEFLQLSVPTIYGMIHREEIPVMKRSKRCYFSKAELLEYLKAGRRKSNDEKVAEQVATYNATKKGGR